MEGMDLQKLLALAALADRFEITDIASVLEDGIMRLLSAETCTDVLMQGGSMGLCRVAEAARRVAIDEFEAWHQTDALLRLDEAALASVLDDDRLVARREELVLQAAARWMAGGEDGVRGPGLLRAVRFGAMGDDFLVGKACGVVPVECRAWIVAAVAEALAARVSRCRSDWQQGSGVRAPRAQGAAGRVKALFGEGGGGAHRRWQMMHFFLPTKIHFLPTTDFLPSFHK